MKPVRGIWLTNVASNVLNSRESIAKAMELLAGKRFNFVFPVVWNKGFTLYRSDVMVQNFGRDCQIDPIYRSQNRDPLQEVIEEAKQFGLKVIPWFEYGFVASAVSINTAGKLQEFGGHILAQKPEWEAIDSKGKPLLKPLLKPNQTGFRWMNALDRQVQKYDVDGIQGDDRLPAFPVEGFDRSSADRFGGKGSKPAYNNFDWMKFRANILTEFLANLRQEVKAIGNSQGKDLLISVAPHPRDFGFREYLQDTKSWIDRNLVDIIHPQLYRRNFKDYQQLCKQEIIGQNFTDAQIGKISPGILLKIGNFQVSNKDIEQIIQYNRSLGIDGEVFFFFEGVHILTLPPIP